MERQKLLQYINKMTKILGPIIEKDPDIIEFIEESELTKDQILAVNLWFTSAVIISSFDDKNKDAAILIKKSMQNMKNAELYLEDQGDFENVHNILMDEFKDNCQEWFQIIKTEDCFKPFLRASSVESEEEEIEQPQEKGKLPKWFELDTKITLSILGPIFAKEEDIDELNERIKGDDLKERVLFLIACGILAVHLDNRIQGNEEVPDYAPFRKDLEYSANYFKQQYELMMQEFSKTMNNFDGFRDLIVDLIDTHYKEFIRKFYKNLTKSIQEMIKKQKGE